MKLSPAFLLFVALGATAGSAAAKPFDAAAMQRWATVEIVHYEVVGEVNDRHVQVPPNGDLYVDVVERVTLSFDWNKRTGAPVGAVTFKNQPAKVTKIEGTGAKCPTGKLTGPYEHFDIVGIRQTQRGSLELSGQRVRPDAMVAQACSSALTLFKGGTVPATEFIGPPDPSMLALGDMIPANSPATISPDGNSLVMKALNNNWTWTFTPVAK